MDFFHLVGIFFFQPNQQIEANNKPTDYSEKNGAEISGISSLWELPTCSPSGTKQSNLQKVSVGELPLPETNMTKAPENGGETKLGSSPNFQGVIFLVLSWFQGG